MAEDTFIRMADGGNDRSGSCAIVVLIIGILFIESVLGAFFRGIRAIFVNLLDCMCYVANVGDCRAFMSLEEGRKVINLSNDHKPCE